VAVEEPRRRERRSQAHAAQRGEHELGAQTTVGARGELGKRVQQLLRHADHDRRQPLHDVAARRLLGPRAEERRPRRAEARRAENLAPRRAHEVRGALLERPRRVGPEPVRLAQRFDQAREGLAAQPGDRLEVVLHGTRRHAGLARHFLQRHAEVAALREQLERGLEQALARLQAPQLVQVRKHCGRNAIPLTS